jgi:molybdopterin converting factor small subunit
MGPVEMIEVHLYGKLRQFADDQATTAQSIALVSWQPGDTVGEIIARLGIPQTDLGSNVFLNGRYANLESPVQDGDRLGLFPDDMQLLYKWYFAPSSSSAAEKPGGKPPHQASRNDQGAKSEG